MSEDAPAATRKGKKAPYRALTIPERDALFAFYEKHGSNMLAMSRDMDCTFKADSQIRYYAKLYNFHARWIEIQRKKAEDVIAGLKDSKILAIRRAIELIAPRQVPLKNSSGDALMNAEGQPVFIEVQPDYKEIKAAWEIIKTELGEPTTISKAEVTDPRSDEITKTLDIITQLTHGGAPDNGSALQGERRAAEDTAPVSPAVLNDPEEKPSA